MELTPLDVRKKSNDFTRALRGYDPGEVESFLELVAERLEEMVRENRSLQERVRYLAEQVQGQEGREKAVQDALVAAQQLRDQIRSQARREGELLRREAEGEAEQVVAEGRKAVEETRASLRDLERRRRQFLERHRRFLEREMDHLEAEEARAQADAPTFEVDLGRLRKRILGEEAQEDGAEEAPRSAGSGDSERLADGEADLQPSLEGLGEADASSGEAAEESEGEASGARPDGEERG